MTFCYLFYAVFSPKIYHAALWSNVEALKLLEVANERPYLVIFIILWHENGLWLFYVGMKSTLWYTVMKLTPSITALKYIQAFYS